ncbi:MAG: Localization factor PodJL [Lentisphaerae bacterium ADurb.BinA184]|nr:MAG: Localization factor PodJL [Lentisphaerae bacterium ADurb.BinA184]
MNDTVQRLRDAAATGNADAQFALAAMLQSGCGVARNVCEAAEWYRKAAQQGHRASCLNLADMYEQGLGVPRDPAEASGWRLQAAGQDGQAVDRPPLRHGAAPRARLEQRTR